MAPFFPEQRLDSPILDLNVNFWDEVHPFLVKRSKAEVISRKDDPFSTYATDRVRTRLLRNFQSVVELAKTSNLNIEDFALALRPRGYTPLFREVCANSERLSQILLYVDATVKPLILQARSGIGYLAGVQPIPVPSTLIPTDAARYYEVEEAFAILVETYTTRRTSGVADPVYINSPDVRAVVSQSICLIRFSKPLTRCVTISYHQLLMFRDAAAVRKNCLIARHSLYPDRRHLSEAIELQFLWQERCLELYGNEGYEIVKSTEALAKTYLVRISGDILAGPDDAFDKMKVKIRTKEKSTRRNAGILSDPEEWLADRYERIVLAKVRDRIDVVELFGLQKMTGHPLIDARESGVKSATKAREKDHTLPSDAWRIRNTVARLFTEAFIAKNRRWPRLTFTVKGTVLERLYTSQTLIYTKHLHDQTEWTTVRFKKEFDLNRYDDFLDLIDDKSISHYRGNQACAWDPIAPLSERRLLLEVLKRPDFNPSDIVDAFETDSVPDEWRIVSLYPKEREFKLSARMFCMLCLEVRTFFALVEANLALTILPYIPQITMTDDKLMVHKRLVKLSKPPDVADIIKVLIELDLSSWNLMWRELIIALIGEDMNALFGTLRVFTWLHKFFSQCLVMVRVAGLRPDGVEMFTPPESDLLWYNHQGGFEGIGQKLWSMATVAMIEVALEGSGYSYSITDQGDNVVVVVTTLRDHNMSERDQTKIIEENVVRWCSESADRIHQEIKVEECVAFTRVVTYSKNVYIDGSEYFTSLKFLSRPFPTTAVDFPSYEGFIQGIFACTYAAAESCKQPDRCYELALIHSALYIIRTNVFSGPYAGILKSLPGLRTMENIRLQLLWPSDLGGLPIIGPYSFLYKGGGDPLSSSLASLKLVQRWSPTARAIIGAALCDDLYSPTPSLESLLQDPYGLPIDRPIAPESAVASKSLDVVKSITVNRDINAVLHTASEEFSESLHRILLSITPFNPVMIRDFVDASPLGTLMALRLLFTKTRTLQAVARSTDETDLVTTFLDAGEQRIASTSRLIEMAKGRAENIGSLYNFVNLLRQRWKPAGIEIKDVTSYLPIDFDVEWHDFSLTSRK